MIDHAAARPCAARCLSCASRQPLAEIRLLPLRLLTRSVCAVAPVITATHDLNLGSGGAVVAYVATMPTRRADGRGRRLIPADGGE